MKVIQMFPDETSDTWITLQSFFFPILVEIPTGRPFDGNIINEYPSYLRDLFL